MKFKTLCAFTILLMTASVNQAFSQTQYPDFLGCEKVPDGTKYLPLPPDTASVQFIVDKAQYEWGKSIRNTERGQQALADVAINIQKILEGFSPIVGVDLNKLPKTVDFLDRIETDACYATQKMKKAHMRKRPYVQFNEPTLCQEEEASHFKKSSYPSSHSSTGWALALMLTELFPQHQEAILLRGYEYGQSRVIAGYHYQSDVDIARLAASAVIARLHADKNFRRELKLVKKEIKKSKGRI